MQIDWQNSKQQSFKDYIRVWPQAKPINNSQIRGVVTHIDDSGLIFLMEEADCDVAFNMSQEIKSSLSEHSHIWTQGNPCFAKFDDGEYYRAYIKQIHEDYSCMVRQINYVCLNQMSLFMHL